jgi:predicted RNA-binding Zn-ribbon protein involved in translation (DUF1610 family)
LGKDDLNLAAPCGMYCGACRHYLARLKGLLKEKGLKKGCPGCRATDRICSRIKRGCRPLRKKEIPFCGECGSFPCASLNRLDERYRTRYEMSLIENLTKIREAGVETWLGQQRKRFTCPNCGDVICIHDGTCYVCNTGMMGARRKGKGGPD